MKIQREKQKASPPHGALHRIDDEDLVSVAGAGASKAGTSTADSPAETLSLNFTKIQFTYTER